MTNLFSPTVVAFLSAMHMGLVLLVLPAFAVQTDYIALEKRLVAVESAMPKLEKKASRYRTIEVDITLHLAVVRQEEAKIQRNYAKYEALIRSWVFIDKLDSKGTESKLSQTQEQTKKLRSALTAWRQQVQQARQDQEEICANKARIDSGSPRQIAQWNESGSRLLETNTSQLRQKQKVMAAAWRGLNSVSSELDGIQLGRLERFLLKKEEYLSMTALVDTSKVTCSELEKDLAKARELHTELKELMKKVFTFTRFISPELKWLQKQVAEDTDFLSNTDRAALKTRIESALAKLESTTLSHPLPVVPELYSRCETFTYASSHPLDPAKIGANLQQAESIVADARSVLSKARAALKEVSNAQAGFGGLREARSCLSSLRSAQADAEETDVDEAFSLVEDLQTRIEDVQRREHLFTIRNQKNHPRVLEIQQIVKEAQLFYQLVGQVAIEFFARLGTLPSGQVRQNLEQLLPDLAKQVKKLEKASKAMTQAVQDAEQRQQIICERAANALPTSTELKTWRQESQSALEPLKAAAKKERVAAGLVTAQTRKVSTAKKKLITVEDSMLIKIRGMADIADQLTKAQEMSEQALTGMQKVYREIDELGKLKESALEELKRIQITAAQLAPRLLNTATITELKAIETRAAALAGRYRQATVAGRLPPPV